MAEQRRTRDWKEPDDDRYPSFIAERKRQLPAFILASLRVVPLNDRNLDAVTVTEELAEARTARLHTPPAFRTSGAKKRRSVSSIASPYAS